MKSGFDRAALGLGGGSEVLEFSVARFSRHRSHGDPRFLTGLELAGQMFGHACQGVDIRQIEYLHLNLVRIDRLSLHHMRRAHDAGNRSGELYLGRWVPELSALDHHPGIALRDHVIVTR